MPDQPLAYELLVINVGWGVFNLIPVPPLDAATYCVNCCPSQFGASTTRWVVCITCIGLLRGKFPGRLIFPVSRRIQFPVDENVMSTRSNHRKRVLSGMRSTGKLHLGNFVGALDNWFACKMSMNAFLYR